MDEAKRHFPLGAVVGQDSLKTVYLANIVDPEIGGLLISGPKGTGKSMVVHSVVDLLPQYPAVDGCPFNCDSAREERLCSLCRERLDFRPDPDSRADSRPTSAPTGAPSLPTRNRRMVIVNLPLSCTEDRLIGSINIESLLHSGKSEVQVGILGAANRNILYVDEVNLLPDHLVDDILDAAASHWSTIEREGLSVSHPAEFVLIGTMNPEEGDLRPQILDRFPLCIRLESVRDPRERVEIVKRNLLFESDPAALHRLFAGEQDTLRASLVEARRRLREIQVSDSVLFAISAACADLKVDGQRPDIVIAKTARAVAALDGRPEVGPEHVLLAGRAALNHRTRDGGLLDPPSFEEIQTVFHKHLATIPEANGSREQVARAAGESGAAPQKPSAAAPPGPGPASERMPDSRHGIDKTIGAFAAADPERTDSGTGKRFSKKEWAWPPAPRFGRNRRRSGPGSESV